MRYTDVRMECDLCISEIHLKPSSVFNFSSVIKQLNLFSAANKNRIFTSFSDIELFYIFLFRSPVVVFYSLEYKIEGHAVLQSVFTEKSKVIFCAKI